MYKVQWKHLSYYERTRYLLGATWLRKDSTQSKGRCAVLKKKKAEALRFNKNLEMTEERVCMCTRK